MRQLFFKVAAALVSALALQLPVQAADMPDVSSVLKKMLAALPVPGIKDELQKMTVALKNTSCGGGLKGCYSAKSGQLQLYFFTSGQAQQTLLLVIDRKLSAPMPMLLGQKLHKILVDTELQSPIISISTTDYQLDTSMMPPDLQKVVRESYFNVDSLSFSSGVQLAARANLGGAIKATMQVMGVKSDQLTLRAAVVMPIPTDLASGIGAGAGMAQAVLKEGDTMKKASADAMKPEAFIEFQLAPGSSVAMSVPQMTLTDATFFINQSLTFGYKGNVAFKNLPEKKILLQFQTPLDPAGAMDLLDFAFRMAMPQSFTLQDQAMMAIDMALSDAINQIVSAEVPFAAGKPETLALSKLGGGYIGNIAAIKKPLLLATMPLSVFQLRNPKPASPYKFGDRTKPFPTTDDPFNVMLLGPLADGGPLLYVESDVRILGQTMGQIKVSVGKTGFHGTAEENLSLKLGPLGNTKIKMLAKADITGDVQNISLKGNLAGQNLLLALSGDTLTIEFSASCVNPFEIKTSVKIQESMDIGQIFEGQGGANVDPSKLQNCIGKDLEAAYNKIAGEYKGLSGYTAGEANAALKKIADAAALQVAAQTVKLAEQAAADAKDAADKATNAANAANAKLGDAQKRVDAAVAEASKFKTDDVKNWVSAGVNAAGDAISGGLKKVGSAVKKATCRLAGNCKRKKSDSEVCIAVYDEEFVMRSHPEMSPETAYNWFVVGDVAACKQVQTQRGSAEFQAEEYRAINAARYGIPQRNLFFPEELTKHWLDIGKKDGAQGSYAFNIRDYRAANPDIDQMNWPSWLDYWGHWLNAGINEGRPINAEFAATEYLANYADLRALLGETNYPAAFDHWVIKGKAEGRKGRIDQAAIAQAAKDAQAVSDAKAAADKANEDARLAVEKAKKLKDQAAWQSIYVFSAPVYYELNKARYGFGNPSDYAGLTKHWLEVGMKDAVQGNSVFNIQSYNAQNPDLWANVTPAGTWEGVWTHWFEIGINEGRAISREFKATEYLALYPDLQQAFGATNYKAAYQHWVDYGKAEGRQGRR